MRISTNSFFDSNINRLNELQSKMDKISQQVSSGRKLLTPADDAVASGRALEINQSQAINQQYTRNREYVKNTLGIVDGSLASINETLQGIHEQVVAAGNGAYSSGDKLSIANILIGQRDQLFSLANATDGTGHYLFSGNKTDTASFSKDVATGVINSAYQGSINPIAVQVDNARTMELGVSGTALFGNTAAIFDKINAAITALSDPATSAADLKTALDNLGGSYSETLQNVTDAQATVGTRLQQLDEMDSLGASRESQYTQTLSSLQDLDYNQALSDLSRQQLILQAAQKTFSQLSGLSLFNFMK